MNNDLERILAWVKTNSPQTLQNLNKPANDEEIAEVEAIVNCELPAIFKNLLKQFDGESDETWLALFGNGNQMLSCKMIIEQYQTWQELAEDDFEPEMETVEYWKDRIESNIIFVKDAVKPLFRHPKWVPFTCMNGNVFRFLDFDPAPGGAPGQIIEVDPESCSYQVLAISLEQALANYAIKLESGKFIVADDGYIEATEEEDILGWGMPEWLN